MLTKRQNLIETIKGGSPDRFVNQYEYMTLVPDPILMHCAGITTEGNTARQDWGFWVTFPKGMPGPFPLHDDEHILLKDVTQWKDVLKAPDPNAYADDEWAPFEGLAASVDRNEMFCASFVATGIFEKLHYFMSIDKALLAFITEPEAMHELIEFLADWEIECAKVTISHIHPDAVFHHDDWGSQNSTFISPEMFEEFFLEPYTRIYKFWKDNGVELVVHHSDSYAATLVPFMDQMGIDIWQGVESTNDIPGLIKKYNGMITYQGGLDNGKYDVTDWSKDKMRVAMRKLIDEAGTKYLIPALTMGGPESTFPGVYEACSELVDEMSGIYFK